MNKTKSDNRYSEDEKRWRTMMSYAQQGDRLAYNNLMSELGNVIEAYLRLRFGSIEILEDCVQECLVSIHKARHTYNPDKAFRPWMFTIIRHRMIDLLRQRRRWMEMHIALNEKESESMPDHVQQLIDGIRILQLLNPDYREAITLTKYFGMTTVEAADWLGVSESAIKARLRRGLNAIHKQLEIEDAML
jgi:RNA polymerase sigma-70 factor (ECF subfamily)